MRDQRGENELPAVFAPPDQDGLQLELQCLFLVSDAPCVLRLPVAAAKESIAVRSSASLWLVRSITPLR